MRRSIRSLSAAAAVCLVLAACGAAAATTPSPSPSPSPAAAIEPSPSASATAMASAEPSVSVPGDSVPIPANSYARVVTDDLRVRSKPGVSDDSKKLEPLLQDGKLVLVLEGPVRASGYDWYRVQPVITEDFGTPDPSGWVAAGADGEPWIQSETVKCPPLPTSVEELGETGIGLAMFFEVTCFGGKEITFEARLRVPREDICHDAPWGVDPVWLDVCVGDAPIFVPVKASPDGLQLVARWSHDFDLSTMPDTRVPQADWPTLEVTGMFDHPGAETCRNRHNYAEPGVAAPDPAMTILRCRMRFVVTSMRDVGR